MQQTSNVEYLFENFSVAEILDIQQKLRNDIDKRKEDVKELVNERYRDLIEAADTIQHMKGKCQETTESVRHLESLNESFSFIKQKTKSSNQVLTVARKAKVVKDSAIYIWKALDENRFIDATVMRFGCLQLCQELKNRQHYNQNMMPDLSPIIAKLEPSIFDLGAAIEKACWSRIINYNEDPTALVDPFICIALINKFESEILIEKYYDRVVTALCDKIEQSVNLESALLQFYSFILNSLKISQNLFLQSGLTNPSYFVAIRKLSKTKEFTFDGSEKIQIDKSPFRPTIPERIMQDISKEIFSDLTLRFIEDVKLNLARSFSSKLDQEMCIKNILLSLGKLNEANRAQKYPTWDGLCDLIVNKRFPLWETFLRLSFKARINAISSKTLTEAFKNINLQNSLKCSFEPFDKLLWDSEYNQNYNTELKKFALSPSMDEQLNLFKSTLANFVSDAESLTILDAFAREDENELRQEISQIITRNVDTLLIELESRLSKCTKSDEQLAIAKLCRFLVYCAPDLKKFLQNDGKSNSSLQKLLTCSHTALITYFTNFINEDIKTFQQTMDVGHLTKTFENVIVWDNIVLNEDTEDGKKIASTIKIPSQISITLYKLLCNVSNQVNRVSGHTLAKSVITSIWLQLVEKVVECYKELRLLLKQSSYPSSLAQTIALQYHFDLLCLKQLVITTRDEQLRARCVLPLSDASSAYESFVDPFDLHVLAPYLQSNLIKAGRGLALLLGTLMPDTFSTNETNKGKTSASKEVHNTLNVNSVPAIPMLSITKK